MKLDLSPTGQGRVIAVTVIVVLGCVLMSLAVTGFMFDNAIVRSRLIWVDIVAPLIIATPVMYFMMSKLRELAIAHARLQVFASTDGLTQVMNRAAFSTLVDAYLAETRAADDRVCGALLVIDADNFKAVNDSYGHDRGDEALIVIANSIKAMLRTPDIVGRLGGEEFGVFLPGAGIKQAQTVAERIRQTVNQAAFVPGGSDYHLSVSVGGAVFERRLPFADLFRAADRQLYAAKQAGRNRVAILPTIAGSQPMAAA